MNGLHNKNTELHNNSDKNSEKVTSIQDQKADEIDLHFPMYDDDSLIKCVICNRYCDNSGLCDEHKYDEQKADEIDAILPYMPCHNADRERIKQAILALKERWEREARINELQLADKKYFQPMKKVSWVDYFINRIAQLGGKE